MLRGGADELAEQRRRPGRARLELRVELAGDEPRVVAQLDVLDQPIVGRDAAEPHPGLGEAVPIGVVDLEPMAVPLVRDLAVADDGAGLDVEQIREAALRRALGFRLKTAGRLLGQFVGYLEDRGAGTITTEDALAWAVLPPGASPAWQAIRLAAVRGFAAYLHGTDPSVQVPPAGLIRRGNDRATPYLYSDAEISAIITAAGTLRPRFRAATYQTLISLLAIGWISDHSTRVIGEAVDSLDHTRDVLSEVDQFRGALAAAGGRACAA